MKMVTIIAAKAGGVERRRKAFVFYHNRRRLARLVVLFGREHAKRWHLKCFSRMEFSSLWRSTRSGRGREERYPEGTFVEIILYGRGVKKTQER
jgi:hypothetical protein